MKIITHNGAFHADEVFAVAMLSNVFHTTQEIDVIRTRDAAIIAAAQNNPNDYVVDVGGIYNPENNNYDHHQDLCLPSAAGLVYRDVFEQSKVALSARPFFREFIAAIDAIDVNRGNIHKFWNDTPELVGFRNVSSLINGFNRNVFDAEQQDEQFTKAVIFASMIIGNELHLANEKGKAETDYAHRIILPNNVAVFQEFSMVWKEKGEHQFALMPHQQGWQIQSRDTSVAVIPENVADVEGFVFRHASGFICAIKGYDAALEYAQTLPNITTSK